VTAGIGAVAAWLGAAAYLFAGAAKKGKTTMTKLERTALTLVSQLIARLEETQLQVDELSKRPTPAALAEVERRAGRVDELELELDAHKLELASTRATRDRVLGDLDKTKREVTMLQDMNAALEGLAAAKKRARKR